MRLETFSYLPELSSEQLVQQVHHAQRGLPVALQLAHHRAGVQMITAGQAQPLGQHPEMDPVILLPVDDRVQGTVNVQQHAVAPAPPRQRGVRREPADEIVVHDDR